MNRLDEQLKELKTLNRDEGEKMKSYRQAKGRLKENEPIIASSLGRRIGIPVVVLSVLFIGFLLTYEWIGENFVPAGPDNEQDDEEMDLFIDGTIEKVYITHGGPLGVLQDIEEETNYVVLEDEEKLQELKERLNDPMVITEEVDPLGFGLEVKLFLDNGESIGLRSNLDDSIYHLQDEVVYQYEWDQPQNIMVELMHYFIDSQAMDTDDSDPEPEDDNWKRYDTIEEALEDFPFNISTPGENPIDSFTIREIFVISFEELTSLSISYRGGETSIPIVNFMASVGEVPEDMVDRTDGHEDNPPEEIIDHNGTELNLFKEKETIILAWRDNEVTYSISSSELNRDDLLRLVDATYGDESFYNSYGTVAEAEADFPYEVVTPGDTPQWFIPDRIHSYNDGEESRLFVTYRSPRYEGVLTFIAQNDVDEEYDERGGMVDLIDHQGMEFKIFSRDDEIQLSWEDDMFYSLSAGNIERDDLLRIVDAMYGFD
ncbi:DUF4367 domain-containing protein [Evansella sp. AB-P1]|uniref:DUF4367 domain-containing protein n=1 Tax=Evansella sp. AB-P1 TaxID=3037653 RepID=UPI00241E722B|nr:DUF4367 domain-containing protein [Evansella sp. AB-P1]MDG5787347.1 DUF4367 domain-containing protein [Evansella sp. AB-P1]